MKERKAIGLLRHMVRAADRIVDLAVLLLILALGSLGTYALWDTEQVYQGADADQYESYKPQGESAGFEELKVLNPEVVGWLELYGTGVDYPLLQAENNDKYVTTDVKGAYSMTGSLFLDCANQADFSDFNTIIYGHNMEKDAMFGSLYRFEEPEFFEEHRYGTLYDGKQLYGLETVAAFRADAYDQTVYAPGLPEEERDAYLERILDEAVQSRESSLTAEDRILLLSTCTTEMTNGRNILAVRILDEVPDDPYEKVPMSVLTSGKEEQVQQGTNRIVWGIGAGLVILAVICLIGKRKRYSNYKKYQESRREKTDGVDQK